jgi:DNA-directed RNA polymerase specialized sigma24 family protein
VQENSPGSPEALAKLCEIYRSPLYAYIRRRGHDPHQAEDLTQEFFARLLEKEFLAGVTREGGKFRSFLLTLLKRFLANEWDRSRAQKRGGHLRILGMCGRWASQRQVCRSRPWGKTVSHLHRRPTDRVSAAEKAPHGESALAGSSTTKRYGQLRRNAPGGMSAQCFSF